VAELDKALHDIKVDKALDDTLVTASNTAEATHATDGRGNTQHTRHAQHTAAQDSTHHFAVG